MFSVRPKPMKTILPRFLMAACALAAASAFADTKLITDGAPLRYLVPPNGDLGGTWRGPGFNDSSWPAGQNGIGYEVNPGAFNASVIADSQAEFSGLPGANAWVNGYYNKALDPDSAYQANDFQPFPFSGGPHGPDNFWTGSFWDWFNGNPPWDEIGAAAVHPNGINNAEEHWVIRRWHSTVSGNITLRFHVRKSNLSGTGVTGKAFKNGTELFTRAIGGGDGTGFEAYINTTANVGDVFDFAHTPVGLGDDPGDGADGSIMTATILSGTVAPPPPPPQPATVADSQTDWSGTGVQGANGWYYGFYNRTADADSTYNPDTDFSTTNPNWTFGGGQWTLGPGDPPWDIIGQTDWHPNGDNNVEVHWVIRRWVSDVDGDLYTRVRFGKRNVNGGNGTTVRVMHNGVEKFSQTVAFNNGTGIDTFVALPGVFIGDKVEFALDPLGTDGLLGDGADGSFIMATIHSGPVPQTTVADSVTEWSATGVQGANGWYYGFYNETADANGVYNPATDFNTTHANWSFGGSAWTLGPGDPPWDIIGQTEWHPNGDNNVEVHWVIKRWVSDVDGDLQARIQFGKQNVNGGNGTTLRVFHNGIQKLSQTVAFNNSAGTNLAVGFPDVFIGDTIEFALDPLGTDGTKNDGADGSYIRAQILTGLPPVPPRPFVPGVADCFVTDVESAMKGVNPSIFVRIPFNVANPAAIETLKLKMKYNDGFAAYLNGTEIIRRNTPTSIAGITVADSIADWSTNPDVTVNGWSYGYYDQTLDPDGTYAGGSDFTPFPHDGGGHSPTDFWTGSGYDWFNGNPPWLELFQEATHPTHPNDLVVDPANPASHVQWAIRRWNATVDANLKARIRFRKLNVNCGDGVRVSVFHNSRQVYSQTILGNDGVGRDDTIDLPDVFLGDNIDIMLGPGDLNDFCDGSYFSAVIFEGEPTIPWNGAATATRTTTQTISPEAFDISSFISQLQPGANLLAIQGFNGAVSDNEFVINAELLANRVPTAVNDTVTAALDTPATYTAAQLLANDTDPDGDMLMLVGVEPDYITSQGGAVRLFGSTIRYTPPAGFTGTDTFTYAMTDLSGVQKRATVSVNVTFNECPSATPLAITVDQGATASFQLEGVDFDGDPLQFTITQPPTKGTLVVQTQTGAGTYTPNAGACGTDSFKFKVSDGLCDSEEATVSITIRDRTSPVLTCPAPITVKLGDPVTITPPIATDGCDGALPSTCVRADGQPLGSPFPLGTTTVTCSATDAGGNAAACSFTVTVRPANTDPVCVARLAPQECGLVFPSGPTLYSIAVNGDYVCLTLDGSGSSDPDGDALTINWAIDETNLLSGAVVNACLDVGCHRITMVVSDGLDQCHQFLDICVITPSEAVEQCIAVVESTDVERRNKRPLIVSLKAAKAAFEREGWEVGAQMLTVFEYKVRAQIQRDNPAEAAMFIECVENIANTLECVVQTPRKEEDGE